MAEELPELVLAGVDDWRTWLAEHGDEGTGVRLVLAKKGPAGPTTLTYAEAVQEALCEGWIDGQASRRDEGTYRVRFTPRRSRSLWSKRNVEYVGRLIEQGRMRPRGLAEVERAKADGRWASAYSGPAGIEVPTDLTSALAAAPAARTAWDSLGGQDRYAILHQLEIAVRPETRQRRLEQFVARLADGGTVADEQGDQDP